MQCSWSQSICGSISLLLCNCGILRFGFVNLWVWFGDCRPGRMFNLGIFVVSCVKARTPDNKVYICVCCMSSCLLIALDLGLMFVFADCVVPFHLFRNAMLSLMPFSFLCSLFAIAGAWGDLARVQVKGNWNGCQLVEMVGMKVYLFLYIVYIVEYCFFILSWLLLHVVSFVVH